MSFNTLFAEVKENNEDFEWYPTTDEIILALYNDLKNNDISFLSFLDIGAGDGKIFRTLKNINEKMKLDPDRQRYKANFYFKKFAIEKSKTLIESLDKDIFIIGTDFLVQSLIDKKMDLIFCNPPYSEYEQWTEKILKEANCKNLYLVIPERWQKNEQLQAILKLRKIEYKIINTFSFLNAEDRKARINVNLIRFDMDERYNDTVNSFQVWFDEHFKLKADKDLSSKYDRERKEKERINSIINKESLIPELVKFYNIDLENLLNTYKKLESIDSELLSELNVNLNSVMESLKLKIENLKSIYWKILFDKLEAITSRLTTQSRGAILGTLFSQTSIDFSENNIYAIIIWVIKNANDYLDSQLLGFYKTLSEKDNIRLYKSNKTLIEDDWRYCQEKMSHYSLDYRLVLHRLWPFDKHYSNKYKISGSMLDFINDIYVIAGNLNFSLYRYSFYNSEWLPGEKNCLYELNNKIFAEIRPFKNGNVHIKLSQEFMKKLNIEAARLNGWIKKPKEATEEFDITLEEAEKYFKSNFSLLGENKELPMLENLNLA